MLTYLPGFVAALLIGFVVGVGVASAIAERQLARGFDALDDGMRYLEAGQTIEAAAHSTIDEIRSLARDFDVIDADAELPPVSAPVGPFRLRLIDDRDDLNG